MWTWILSEVSKAESETLMDLSLAVMTSYFVVFARNAKSEKIPARNKTIWKRRKNERFYKSNFKEDYHEKYHYIRPAVCTSLLWFQG